MKPKIIKWTNGFPKNTISDTWHVSRLNRMYSFRHHRLDSRKKKIWHVWTVEMNAIGRNSTLFALNCFLLFTQLTNEWNIHAKAHICYFYISLPSYSSPSCSPSAFSMHGTFMFVFNRAFGFGVLFHRINFIVVKSIHIHCASLLVEPIFSAWQTFIVNVNYWFVFDKSLHLYPN